MKTYCRCGCGELVKLIWFSEECRSRYRYLQGLSINKRRKYAKERTERNARLDALPTHTAFARIHTVNQEEESLVQEQLVTITTPKLGIWGY